jgi:hypothetical protein
MYNVLNWILFCCSHVVQYWYWRLFVITVRKIFTFKGPALEQQYYSMEMFFS